MKTRVQNSSGLTLIEAMIVVAIIAVLVAMLLPDLSRPRARAKRINCVNNLKQVGLSYRQWALDHHNNYPMQLSITNGGAMEWAAQGIAWPAYQVMSNELSTPKILVCPADKPRKSASSFNQRTNAANLSYFIGVDAHSQAPQMFLSGDSNLEINRARLRSGIVTLLTNRLVGWSDEVHQKQGNVGLADGSVQGFSTSRMRDALVYTGDTTNRIILP